MNSLFIENFSQIRSALAIKPIAGAIFLYLILTNQGLSDNEVSSTEMQLNKINQIIMQIEVELEKKHKNHNVINKELGQLEREIGQLHQDIQLTKEKIKISEDQYHKLQQKSKQLNNKLKSQNKQFKQQVRLAYSAESQSKWKLLLSQNSLQHAGRNAVIYDYIHEARSEQISRMRQLAADIRDNQQAKIQQQETLQNLLNKQTNDQTALQNVRNEKQLIQKQLADSIDSYNRELKSEKSKQSQLKKLLNKLKLKQAKGNFAQQKGQLSWPIEGSLKRRFGDTRQKSVGIEWEGVLLKAQKGTEVKAIYPGTVIFADWFDKYGWLMIIDHGGDYMSLYAHAEGLYKNINETVKSGDLIAVVGDSGDIEESGLYFEIRRKGTPVDPASWCVTPKMAYSP